MRFNNTILKYTTRFIAVSMCFLIGFSAVGCGNSKEDEKEVSTTALKDFLDVRTAKIINLQQAILTFTSKNKAGSISSVKLEPVDGKYIYTIEAITKDSRDVLLTIDASSGKTTQKKDTGIASADKKKNLVDFVPVLDVEKAAEKATSYSTKDFFQVVSYKLYFHNGINIYEFTLGDGSSSKKDSENEESKEENVPKTEVIYVNAVTGEKVDPKAITTSNTSNSTTTTSNNSAGENTTGE